eukprot:TRINITY_DN8685_c5_g1_i1.p1 TRINITY_DN8685_c5_g1~~TRINITY_DN8685_c5_g1_i1.p1  ORF type:complete len:387 (+),score=150.41 TRINITY_DN8685_c5_g1_i1:60-1220(+)
MAGWGALKSKLGGPAKIERQPSAAEVLASGRKLVPAALAPAPAPAEGAALKYFRRGDREREREEQCLRERAEQEAERRRKRLEWAGAAGNAAATAAASKGVWLPNQEVVRRLRERGEPATLFGETEADRLARLHELTSSEISLDDMTDLGKNHFRERLAKAETDALERDRARIEQGKSALEVEEEEEAKIAAMVQDSELQVATLRSSLARIRTEDPKNPTVPLEIPEKDEADYVRLFIETVLLEWKVALLRRPWEVKKSFAGKRESARHEETVIFMTPLVDSLRKGGTASSVVSHFYRVAFYTVRKEYVRANDYYLKMAIGSAAWPLGVTQVGIHSRVGRERIESSKQAHILNNETQRKFIQGMKRLISQMQCLHPTNPSKMIRDA